MNLIKKNLAKLFLTANFLLLPLLSFADTHDVTCDPTGGKICNPIAPIDTISDFIAKFLQGAIKIGIPVFALAVIYCGFLFVFARGNEKKIEEAKSASLGTAIGGAVFFGAYTIAKVITNTVTSLG